MTTNPSPDAVEVLQRIADGCDDAQDVATDFLRKHKMLPEQGFINTRQPAMTDAELYSEMKEAMRLKGLRKEVAAIVYAMTAAKKYRG